MLALRMGVWADHRQRQRYGCSGDWQARLPGFQ
ncbi:hypothetical protein YPPY102_0774, partial [Yersinia pestis PY-102]